MPAAAGAGTSSSSSASSTTLPHTIDGSLFLELCSRCHAPLDRDLYIARCGHVYHGRCCVEWNGCVLCENLTDTASIRKQPKKGRGKRNRKSSINDNYNNEDDDDIGFELERMFGDAPTGNKRSKTGSTHVVEISDDEDEEGIKQEHQQRHAKQDESMIDESNPIAASTSILRANLGNRRRQAARQQQQDATAAAAASPKVEPPAAAASSSSSPPPFVPAVVTSKDLTRIFFDPQSVIDALFNSSHSSQSSQSSSQQPGEIDLDSLTQQERHQLLQQRVTDLRRIEQEEQDYINDIAAFQIKLARDNEKEGPLQVTLKEYQTSLKSYRKKQRAMSEQLYDATNDISTVRDEVTRTIQHLCRLDEEDRKCIEAWEKEKLAGGPQLPVLSGINTTSNMAAAASTLNPFTIAPPSAKSLSNGVSLPLASSSIAQMLSLLPISSISTLLHPSHYYLSLPDNHLWRDLLLCDPNLLNTVWELVEKEKGRKKKGKKAGSAATAREADLTATTAPTDPAASDSIEATLPRITHTGIDLLDFGIKRMPSLRLESTLNEMKKLAQNNLKLREIVNQSEDGDVEMMMMAGTTNEAAAAPPSSSTIECTIPDIDRDMPDYPRADCDKMSMKKYGLLNSFSIDPQQHQTNLNEVRERKERLLRVRKWNEGRNRELREKVKMKQAELERLKKMIEEQRMGVATSVPSVEPTAKKPRTTSPFTIASTAGGSVPARSALSGPRAVEPSTREHKSASSIVDFTHDDDADEMMYASEEGEESKEQPRTEVRSRTNQHAPDKRASSSSSSSFQQFPRSTSFTSRPPVLSRAVSATPTTAKSLLAAALAGVNRLDATTAATAAASGKKIGLKQMASLPQAPHPPPNKEQERANPFGIKPSASLRAASMVNHASLSSSTAAASAASMSAPRKTVGGDLIARGYDGRGGYVSVLKPATVSTTKPTTSHIPTAGTAATRKPNAPSSSFSSNFNMDSLAYRSHPVQSVNAASGAPAAQSPSTSPASLMMMTDSIVNTTVAMSTANGQSPSNVHLSNPAPHVRSSSSNSSRDVVDLIDDDEDAPTHPFFSHPQRANSSGVGAPLQLPTTASSGTNLKAATEKKSNSARAFHRVPSTSVPVNVR